MLDYGTISFTIGFIALIEALVILSFPFWTKKTIESLLHTRKDMRRLGMIEIILAMILLMISIFLR
ncbi:hypothetical protein COU57_05375 [Candidatus Pacearchaeota archaeon CG10_big_fil_rev_8_21_14_0_10_32_14]|nr:MAG: hypothetical protein COU57_05375 [Candidatus Pacearchaeota archaeon CG10_big_fil_rev_8_21_14_0_10_32_14]